MIRRVRLRQPRERHPAGPVETRKLPTVTCARCQLTMIVPGDESASTIMTDHYRRQHATIFASMMERRMT